MGDTWGAAWRSLKSTQTTLYLLVALAVASVVGTVMPQGQPAEAYADHFGKALGSLMVSLGLNHVFTTWWYLLLLALLLVSAAACAQRIWRLGRGLAAGPSLRLLQRKLQVGKSCGLTETVPTAPEQVVERLARSLRGRRYRVEAGPDEADARWLVARKHGWAGYGIFLSHVAIFSIAVGAVLGMWPGLALDKMVNLTEGEVYTDTPGDFDFSLRLNSFALDYYPDGTTVKAYKSDVSVLEGGAEVKRQVILVNHPLTYHHVKFYQSNFGIAGFGVKVTPAHGPAQEVRFPLEPGSGEEGPMYEVPADSTVQFIGGKQSALVAQGFSPAGAGNACPVAGSGGADASCATANLTLVSGFNQGGKHAIKDLGWIKQGQPVSAEGYTLELEPARYYTGLNVRRDDGVPLVWLGFGLLVGGLMLTFYFKPHTLVARITGSGARAQVTLAAFEKGGAGQERWQEKPYPVLGQLLGSLGERAAARPGSGPETREEEEDDY
jgi:cytochrome c biogenesis protein